MNPKSGIVMLGSVFALSCLALLGCPQATHFGWTYSLTAGQNPASIARSSQGGYYVLGQGTSPKDTLEMMAVKLSDTGSVEWWQLVDDMRGYFGAPIADGGVVLVADTGTSAATYQLRAVKRDRSGNPVWDHLYGEIGVESLSPKVVTATSGGGVTAAGYGRGLRVFLLNLAADGSVTWMQQLPTQFDGTSISAVKQLQDGGFVMLGVVSVPGTGRLFRLDADGNLLWWKQYDGQWNTIDGFSVDVAADGGFVVAGAEHPGDGTCAPTVIRTDADGNVLWKVDDLVTTVATDDMRTRYTAHTMLVDGEGHIVVAGEFARSVRAYTGIFEVVSCAGYVMQLDGTGKRNWTRSLGTGRDYQDIRDMTLTESGDYITLGQTNGGKIQVVRVRKNGTIM